MTTATKNILNDGLPSDASLEAEYGYYAELSSANDVGEFNEKIDDAIRRLGFSEYAFVRLDDAEKSDNLITVTRELLDVYYKQGLYEHDLGIQYANNNERPVFRSTLNEYVFQANFDFDYKRCMREIDELNQSFGYYDFFSIPTKAINGHGKVQLSVTRRGMTPFYFEDLVKKCSADLHLLCRAIDVVATRKFPGELLGKKQYGGIAINPQPLRVLDTLANNDMNIAQVADKLGIKEITANKHLQAARRAFGVQTNYAAIRLAVQKKLIEFK